MDSWNSYLFAGVAMLLWGVAPIFGKLGLTQLEPLAALTIRSAIVTLLLLIFMLWSGNWSALGAATPRAILFIALEGLCAALFGQLAYYYALKYGEVGRVSPLVSAFPLVALAVAIVFLGEKITWGKMVGAFLIVSGIMLLRW